MTGLIPPMRAGEGVVQRYAQDGSVRSAGSYRAFCRQNTTERVAGRMLQSALPAERYRARCLWMVQLSMGHDRIVVRSQQSQRLVIKLISEHLPYLAVMCGAAGREHLVWLHLNSYSFCSYALPCWDLRLHHCRHVGICACM